MKLLSFHKLGIAHNAPRFWIESKRLNSLGFTPGTLLKCVTNGHRITLTPSPAGELTVSQRRDAGSLRPIIDINSRTRLFELAQYPEIKVTSSQNRIELSPSVRGFYIHKRLSAAPPYKVLELFPGGGLMSAALGPDYELVAGVECEPAYADVWQTRHQNATLIQSDIRMVHASELPGFDILLAGIPCTSHSTMARAKHSLAGKPELGETGDLYMSVGNIVANRMPLACVFENVPSFATSLAGMTLRAHLQKLGYHITEMVLDPHGEWNEPQDRKRWVMVATLRPGFTITVPNTPFSGDLTSYLDPVNTAQDEADAVKIANTIECLKKHNARHAALGHGFAFTTITRQSTKVPTLVRSYHKINVGPFVETPHGPRMLRKSEAERLMGCDAPCDHYATAIQVLFQGVQTRVFRQIMDQLSTFLFTEWLQS